MMKEEAMMMMMMRHGGGLGKAMKTCLKVEGVKAGLAVHFSKLLARPLKTKLPK